MNIFLCYPQVTGFLWSGADIKLHVVMVACRLLPSSCFREFTDKHGWILPAAPSLHPDHYHLPSSIFHLLCFIGLAKTATPPSPLPGPSDQPKWLVARQTAGQLHDDP